MTHVAVLVPGIMGSVLAINNEIIWPGPVGSLIFEYDLMGELMSDQLVAVDCIRSFSISTQYQALIDDLGTCGFRETDSTLVVAPYDWRRSNAIAAEDLATRLDTIAATHGSGVEISLIAHSMGGLVGRYYLESGEFAGRSAFHRVKRLITLATPHRGAAVALPVVLGQEKRLFLSKEQVHRLSSDERFPSAYQLLPVESEPFAWDRTPGAAFGTRSVYDPATANSLGLVAKNLASAQQFHSKLSAGARPGHVRYFCFCGTRQTTATHVHLSNGRGGLTALKIEREDGGDGTVPVWSSGIPGVQRIEVGGEHGTIYKNGDLRRVLGTLLGRPGLLAVATRGEVALRDRVVEPGTLVHGSVAFDEGVDEIDGEIRVERTQIDRAGVIQGFDAAPTNRFSIRYQGVGTEAISVVFKAPDVRGIYRVGFYPRAAQPVKPNYDELIVQDPPAP